MVPMYGALTQGTLPGYFGRVHSAGLVSGWECSEHAQRLLGRTFIQSAVGLILFVEKLRRSVESLRSKH